MIAELPRYPDYKDSGAPWLGDVPEHWEVLPNRAIFTEVNEREHPEEQMLSVTITKGVIRQRALLADSSKKDSSRLDKSAYKLVRPGDIAYNKMRAWQGAIGASDYQGIISPAYVVQRPRGEADSHYLHYLLRTPAFATEAERWSYGITSDMWSLRPEHFRMIYGCLPPPEEQSGIVRFLDHADRRIRRSITAKTTLIALLNEQKQAIIHRTVTRGLDPDGPRKPTGVEWLGNVPEHWKVVPLKYLAKRIQNGSTPPSSEPIYYEQGTTPWYGPSSCGHDELVGAPVGHLADAAFATGHARLIHGPALLVVVIGATAGRMAILGHDGSTNQQITSYELRTDLANASFALRQIRGAERWLRATASTATIPILDGGQVARLSVAIPSLAEQEQIVRHVDDATEDLNAAIERAEIQIPLLHEYRIRLVADVVTGKLDVREAAAQLPDQVEEAEAPGATEDLGVGDESEADPDLDAVVEEVVA